MTLQKLTLMTLCALITLGFSGKKEPSENLNRMVQNPAFDTNKVPKDTEPKLKLSLAKQAWKSVKSKPNCDQRKAWLGTNDPNVRVTTFKNPDEIPVKAIFERNRFEFHWNSKSKAFEGTGVLDLSSFLSGNDARDRRVMREVLLVENGEYSSVAKVDFAIDNLDLGTKPVKTDLAINLVFHGNTYPVVVPVKVWLEKGKLRLESQKESRFSFSNAYYMMAGMLRMMDRCNHKSIGSFVDVGFDVTLNPTCN